MLSTPRGGNVSPAQAKTSWSSTDILLLFRNYMFDKMYTFAVVRYDKFKLCLENCFGTRFLTTICVHIGDFNRFQNKSSHRSVCARMLCVCMSSHALPRLQCIERFQLLSIMAVFFDSLRYCDVVQSASEAQDVHQRSTVRYTVSIEVSMKQTFLFCGVVVECCFHGSQAS